MGKKRRRSVSLGSVIMLAVTALVVAGCLLFLLTIVGDDVYERTGALIRSLSEQGLFERAPGQTQEPEAGETPDEQSADELQAPEPVAFAAPDAQASALMQECVFTLAAAGTVCAPRALRTAAESGSDYDFNPMLQGVSGLLDGADLALATLETVTAGEQTGYGSYNAPAQLLDALRGAGVSVLSLATEHALDCGYSGLELTQREMNTRSMLSVGADASGAGNGVRMLDIGGMQVAVLAYAYGLSDEGRAQTNGDERGALSLIDEEAMVRDIVSARLSGANVVIVMPHWGTKNRRETPDDVRALARRLAEAGADVILGAHPDVVQGTERLSVTRSDGLTYDAVACYSLGCLLTDARAPENTAGMVARLTIRYDPQTRRIALGELACTPVYVACQREDGRSVYRVVDAQDGAALALLNDSEKEAAALAAQTVREAIGQNARAEGER